MSTVNDMKCKQVRELLPDYSVEAVSSTDRVMIASHLSECAECASELTALNRTAELLNMTAMEVAPDQWNAINAKLTSRHQTQSLWGWLGNHRFQFEGVAAAFVIAAMLLVHPVAPVKEDTGSYLAQHASMSWREPFADKAGLGLLDTVYTETSTGGSH